ncbi:hypothetical protein NSE01_19550 [Novosphingobium sediminis]|uniref:Peptidase M48 domain-containing protein n=1 Tax=Novosphingobium sediminis TaxID=707214 RepID=A0A512AKB8_9SPHN|nr:hypothetical protein [Novosphingobium sediminis]GEO00123.1 hypothetical protein NSE01_19550 [Novosphingobium sediminis]
MTRASFGIIAAAVLGAAAPAFLFAQTAGEQPASGREKGQCELGKEWSEARLHDYWPTEGRVQSRGALGYMGQQNATREIDIAEARAQVERVVRVSGLEMNFEMIIDPSTPAAAEIINGRRVILFDPRFMAQMADRICPDWGAMSILAHEVGHHLAGHTLRQSAEPWRDELEADEFSGFVLARLGASLAETTSAAARILPEQATPTHPGRKDRIAAIVHGWQNAEALVSAELSQARHNRGLVPMKQSRFDPDGEGDGASDLALMARMILYDDPNDYYITKSGRIDAYDGTRRPVGRKAIPSSADYAWTFQTDATRFDVDYSGRVLMRLPSGIAHEVGVVVALLPRAAGSGE